MHWLTKHVTEKFTDGMKLGIDLGAGKDHWKPYKKCKFINVDRYGNDLIVDLNHKLPFEDEKFDIALSYSVLTKLDDPFMAIDEAYRILKPKGIFVVVTENKEWNQKHLWSMLRWSGFKSIYRRHISDWLFAMYYNIRGEYSWALVEKPG